MLTVELGEGSGDATFVFRQEGEVITGTYSGVLGDDVAVTGRVADGKVEFSFDSQAGRITYQGTVEGDRMEGTLQVRPARGRHVWRGAAIRQYAVIPSRSAPRSSSEAL